VWTKLELDQQERPDELQLILDALNGMKNLDFEEIKKRNGLPSYPGKDPVDMVAEYLSEVRKYVMKHPPGDINETFLSTVPIDLVVTVPAVSEATRQISDS
jgi:hypothetical protein